MDKHFFIKKDVALLKDVCSAVKVQPAFTIEDDFPVLDVCSVESLEDHCLTFIKSKKHLAALETAANVVFLVPTSLKDSLPERKNILLSENPEADFARVAQYLYPEPFLDYPNVEGVSPKATLGKNVRIGPGAIVGQGAKLADNVVIGANVVIGPHVVIGTNSIIHAGATIMCAVLGSNVVVHQNVSIGQAGFGFAITQTGMVDIPQLGRVLIDDNVHIGACCTIDRGGLQDTVIGAHTRIDNLVQIAHNVRIGRGCVMVSQSGVAGSTQIGDFSIIGGQVGIADNLKIGKGVKIASKSGVMRDIEDGAAMGGVPCVPIKQWHRTSVALAKLVKKGTN